MQKIFIITIIFYLLFATAGPVLAVFDPEYIISDNDLVDYSRMSANDIQNFFNQFPGALKDYQTKDIDDQLKPASEIIFNAAVRHQINPQVLITLIQKEQALVTKKAEKPTQYDWATGFAAYDNRRPVNKFRGFAIQVDRAAWRLRYFLESSWEFVFRPGQTYKISGKLITPRNLATAALYNYTPHLIGNKLFWQIWQKWFANTSGPFEEGSLVRAIGDKGVWLIQNGERRPFRSKNVFLSRFNFNKVKEVSLKELEKYPIGKPVEFANYSLLQAPNNGIYLLVDGMKRPIVSEKVFKEIGFNLEEVIKVDWDDLSSYQDGPPITTPYPTGALLKDRSSGIIYWVKDNIKQPILIPEIIEINFPYTKVISVESKKLDGLALAEPVKFRDGTLLKAKNSPTIYFIVNGRRCPISDPETFEALGYQWKEVITVPENVLELHELGEKIELASDLSN
jgi:hypothetical protein